MSISGASAKPHILVVDDDDRLRALLKKFLTEQGFIVSSAASTSEARQLMEWYVFDLMVLDVMMPGQTGVEWLASEKIATPVLMLSALGEPHHRISGLEVGAEDYLNKPFEPKELVLRLRAILRRTEQQKDRSQSVAFGEYRFDIGTRILRRAEQVIALTSSEADMLALLAVNSGMAVARETLLALLPTGSNERSVDVQMSRLRKKVEDREGRTPYLQTIRGAGYVLHAQ